MDNHSHALLTDDCDDCHYIANAFTLLSLPLTQLSITELNQASSSILILCKNIENQHKKKLTEYLTTHDVSLISFNTPEASKSYPTAAVSFLKMPFTQQDLIHTLSRMPLPNNEYGDLNIPVFDRLVGKSKQILQIKSFIKQVADSDTTVLIMGQSGTGKDVIASCIHYLSNRNKNLLVPINCGAIPSELMESELFGHEKGAFTGALTRRPGRFEIADKGTLFLDEIGDMPLPMQVKLLRVIQDRCIERVGGNASIKVDVRLIAATHQPLEELIKQNRFREDLYYRLNVFPIQVPSLSERKDDIPLIIEHHLDKIYERLKHRVIFTENAKEILSHYAWPGNIRELANFLERMVILYPDQVIDENKIDHLYKQNKSSHLHESFNIKEYMSKIEQQVIKTALERSNGIIQTAAEYLSIGKTALIEKMKKYNL